MTVSLSLGWWLVPVLVTILAFARAILLIRRQTPGSDYGAVYNAVAAFIMLMIAAVISLAAWLGWLIWRAFA